MVVFYSGKSGNDMIDNLLPVLKELHSIDVRLYDVDIPDNYFLLMVLEDQYEDLYGKRGGELPVVFVGEDVIAGGEEIWGTLESAVARYEALGGCEFPLLPESEKTGPTSLKYQVYLAYFYNQGCPKCERVGSLIEYLRKRYRGLVVRAIDIETPEAQILNESLCEQMDVQEAKRLTAPSIFFARDALVGEEITISTLQGLIHKYATLEGMDPPWRMAEMEKNLAETRILERFKTLGVSAVAAAGLIDGVNPCAFATLIFFVSYLTFVGKARREILLVGLAFSLSVFVTYFLVGLGLLRVLQSISVVPAVGRSIYLATIGLALGLGGLSLYDYNLCRKGRPSDMWLQMPAFLKNQVRGIIRREAWWNRYILAAIATGFVVSILELTCTGQVYLPTILFVSRFQGLKASALGYLALYNFMFIVPLLGVFALVFFGTGSERLSLLFQRHVGRVKLATSLVFFVLAGVLALTLL
jgi:thiol-disulfide isomerase/thioredoxin